MSHEIQTSFEIKLTSEQLKNLEELKAKLRQAAEKANIPSHDPKHKAQKPREVKIDQHINQDGENLTFDLEAKAFCYQAGACYTYWDFNPETQKWEMPESLKRLKGGDVSKFDFTQDLFKNLGSSGKL